MAISLLIAVCFLAGQCVDAKLCRIRSLGGVRSVDCVFGCCYTTKYTCCQQPFYSHTWFIVSVVGAAGSTLSVIVVMMLAVAWRRRQQIAASVEQPACVVGPRGAPVYTASSGHLASENRNFTYPPTYSVQPASRGTLLHTVRFAHTRTTPMDSPPAYTEQPSAIPFSSAQAKPSGAETLLSTTARRHSDGSLFHSNTNETKTGRCLH